MLSKCNFANIFIFNVLLHNANPKIIFSHIYFCYFGRSSQQNWQSRPRNPPKKLHDFLYPCIMRTTEYQSHLEQNFAHYTREITVYCQTLVNHHPYQQWQKRLASGDTDRRRFLALAWACLGTLIQQTTYITIKPVITILFLQQEMQCSISLCCSGSLINLLVTTVSHMSAINWEV